MHVISADKSERTSPVRIACPIIFILHQWGAEMNSNPTTLSQLSEPSRWLMSLLSDPKKCLTARHVITEGQVFGLPNLRLASVIRRRHDWP